MPRRPPRDISPYSTDPTNWMPKQHKKRVRPTPEEMVARRTLIAGLWNEGLSNRQIAERLGWGNRDTAVGGELHRMRKLGWEVERRVHTDREEMARRKAVAAELWEAGWEAVEIAYELGISDSACDSMLYLMRAKEEIKPHRETAPRDGPVQAAIASMAARGDTVQEIADRLHMTSGTVGSTIYRIRRRVAPHLEPTAEVPPRFIPGEAQRRHEEVWRLAKEGVSREEIAARCGYELAMVKQVLSGERMRRREEGEPESSLVLERPSEKKIRARRLEVWELARSGYSRDEIAGRTGYGPKWVEKVVREERARRRAAGEGADELTLPGFSAHNAAKVRRAEVWDLAMGGLSREEIANRTGYTVSSVKGIINQERIRRRYAGAREADLQLPLAPGAVPFTLPGFWTEEKIEQLVALYQAGNGPAAIAEMMGLRYGQVSSRLSLLADDGIIVRVRAEFTAKRVKELHMDYWESGLSLRSWSAQKNIHRPVITRHFRKHRLPIRPTKPGRAPRSTPVHRR
jgi:DNA-binding CsgD family transcriptional regulator